MEKIFDSEVEKYLLDSGVSEKEVNKIKYTKYKEGMLKVAKTLLTAIEKDDYSLIEKYIDDSPAGDDMGIDSKLLNFHFIDKRENHYGLVDISDAFNYLKSFKE